MGHQSLYRKWRPTTFSDVVGQENISGALQSQTALGTLSHAYIFTGTRGTGKTSCAKILARAANCLDLQNGNPCNKCSACLSALSDSATDITEIDAASNNGVDNIRSIIDEVSYVPTALLKRVYIIDEVHMLSSSAFNALLKTLEEPPEHAIFILATTEIHKVPATILSRCQRYDFRRISADTIAEHLINIAKAEKLELSADGAALLARKADGSMRDAISLLDRCIAGDELITAQSIAQTIGIASSQALIDIFSAAAEHDGAQALSLFYDYYLAGSDVYSLLDEFLSLVRDVYIMKTVKSPEALLEGSAFMSSELSQLASIDTSLLEFYVETISDTLTRLTRSAIRRADAEMCLLKLSRGQTTQAPQVVQIQQTPDKLHAAAPATEQPKPTEPVAVKRAEPEASAPKRTETVSTGGDSDLKEWFFAALKGKRMNSAVATYIRMSDYSAKGTVLEIRVDEEGLLFLDRENILAILREAATQIGMSAIKLLARGETEAEAGANGGLSDILAAAAKQGVEIKGEKE